MYKFVLKGKQGWWLEIPPVANGYNPILDEVRINHMNNAPHVSNELGLYVYVNTMGGWHTGKGDETFTDSKESAKFPKD